MAQYLQGLFGGAKPSPSPTSSVVDDADFADFATPEPSPASIVASSPAFTSSGAPMGGSTAAPRPYTSWYKIWERTSPADFYQEMVVLPFIIVLVVVHLWGTRVNRKRARSWMTAHAPVLQQEFALIGFEGPKTPSLDDVVGEGLAKATAADNVVIPEAVLKEKSASEFYTYATGRQNVAFLDVKLTFLKRYNPLGLLAESTLGLFFESFPPTKEQMQAVAYSFDGKEEKIVPPPAGKSADEPRKLGGNSSYDGFVWAVVHKDAIKELRDERYDLSLTATKDHPKLPNWATVMSENAEITETLLTPDLVKAITEAGDRFESLIVSDQPLEQPKKLNDTVPKKRVSLTTKIVSNPLDYNHTVPLFHYFIRMSDQLVSSRFRPEVLRRVKQTREEEIRKIKKVDDEEKAEERRLQADKAKKEKRDATLKGLTADQQRKYLDKEREKETRKGQKRMTVKN